MAIDNHSIILSAPDEERFGLRTARAKAVTLETLPEIMDFCRINKVVLLVSRCSTSDLPVAQAMERSGFLLMDTLIYYQCTLAETLIPKNQENVLVRPFRPGDEKIIEIIAGQSFRDYRGHYHADERLPRDKCDQGYASWAYNLVISNKGEGERIVAEIDGSVVGFSLGRVNSPEEYERVLSCVAPSVQKKGVYKAMVIECMNWCKSNKFSRILVSTQITNTATQKVWSRLGFGPHHSYYTFHKWFD